MKTYGVPLNPCKKPGLGSTSQPWEDKDRRIPGMPCLCILIDFQVNKRTFLKTKVTKGTGEVTQWLRAVAVLAEDLV